MYYAKQRALAVKYELAAKKCEEFAEKYTEHWYFAVCAVLETKFAVVNGFAQL